MDIVFETRREYKRSTAYTVLGISLTNALRHSGIVLGRQCAGALNA